MRWKYVTIFLMGLLCLVSGNEVFSQHCFKISYDKNGNRVSFIAKECDKYERGSADVEETLDVLEENPDDEMEDLFVYPNPNNGRFQIELKGSGGDDLVELYVYDNKGILITSQNFVETVDVDISNYPAGAYLLRIIRDKGESSEIVVKL